jgi:hypothetical protein
LTCCHCIRSKVALIHILDGQMLVELHFIGFKLAVPISEVLLVEATSHEEANDVHQELFVGVLDISYDGHFLAIGAIFEEKFGQVLGIIWDIKVNISFCIALCIGLL